MTGRLIVLEGPDGVGKSTTASAIVEQLQAAGERARLIAFPGNEPGSIGRLVYELHHTPEQHGVHGINPTSMQVMHAAAHIDAMHTRIMPAIESGDVVVMDRFWWSTIVYGRVAGVEPYTLDVLENLARRLWSRVQPVGAFLMLRARSDKVDPEINRVRTEYERFVAALDMPYPIHRIDDDAPTDELVVRILNHSFPTDR